MTGGHHSCNSVQRASMVEKKLQPAWEKASTGVRKSFKQGASGDAKSRGRWHSGAATDVLRRQHGGAAMDVLRRRHGGAAICCGKFFCWNQHKQCYNRHNDLLRLARAATGGIFSSELEGQMLGPSVRHAMTGTTACWKHPREGAATGDDGCCNRRRPELKAGDHPVKKCYYRPRDCCNLRRGSCK